MPRKYNPLIDEKLDYYESGGGSGSSTWGSITGTLSAQTDLQTALNGKANTTHTHVIADVTGLQTALDGKAASLGADDNYVTDAEKVKLTNLSGTNSGDNAVNSLYFGLVSNANHTGDATGSTALTLATVNANVGSFTNANITVNAKGLITAASNGSGGGDGSVTITETEVDFGTTPVTDKTFTITNASITATSKIIVTESGSIGTGRIASGDSLWDSINYSCVPATGSFTLFARASGSVVGNRKLYYTFA